MPKILFLFVTISASLLGCTAFQLRSQDGATFYARSMEFGFPLHSDVIVVPRGKTYHGAVTVTQTAAHWKVRYGFIALNQSMAPEWANDGMNEKGLVVGALLFRNFAQYQNIDPSSKDPILGPWELPTYLLFCCATLQEVKAAVAKVVVAPKPLPQMNQILPLHFFISDATGASIVIRPLA